MPDHPNERRAEPGELCTCGRPAVIIYFTDHGDLGHCGRSDGGGSPVTPCPWCGATEPHTSPLGPGKCPRYSPLPPARTEASR